MGACSDLNNFWRVDEGTATIHKILRNMKIRHLRCSFIIVFAPFIRQASFAKTPSTTVITVAYKSNDNVEYKVDPPQQGIYRFYMQPTLTTTLANEKRKKYKQFKQINIDVKGCNLYDY